MRENFKYIKAAIWKSSLIPPPPMILKSRIKTEMEAIGRQILAQWQEKNLKEGEEIFKYGMRNESVC